MDPRRLRLGLTRRHARAYAARPAAWPPEWVARALGRAASVAEEGEPYRWHGWQRGVAAGVKERLTRGRGLAKAYHRVRFGDPTVAGDFRFHHPLDSPFSSEPAQEPAFWLDPDEEAERLYVQLGPQFPPSLWIPLKPSAAAIRRLFNDFAENDLKYLEAAYPEYEAYLQLGSDALSQRAIEPPTPPTPPLTTSQPEKTLAALTASVPDLENPSLVHSRGVHALVPDADPRDPVDLYRRAAGLLSALAVKKPHRDEHWYHLGATISPEDLEMRLMAVPFVYSRWPKAVVGGQQRDTRAGERGVFVSAFTTVHSKSTLVFTTREDEPSVAVNVPEGKYEEMSSLYVCVNQPASLRMSGGADVVERYNRQVGCDFPLTTPVDVLGALSLFRPKAVTQVAKEYSV
eukprot:gene9521-14788_t